MLSSVIFWIIFSKDLFWSSDNVFAFNSGTVPANNSVSLDFNALNASNLGSDYTFNFDKVKGITINNQETGVGSILTINATGTDGYTGIFNGETGNYKVNPYGSFVYSNFYGDNEVSSSNRYLHFVNNSTGDDTTSGNINYSYVLIGVTG